ncbi:proline dehydrogenase family protein [Halovivax limisalsi]|uniref:proline dehydrogenase family protein n=1 Tax=Halovivax limisalsi TaxID=1453760 RepID=UPI001FFD80EF|nr:proline dehydrogenase family protein [Halovivax limisalsi]
MIPPLASRFVAGESIPAAVAHVERLNDAGIAAAVNNLGSHVEAYERAADATRTYQTLATTLADDDLAASIAVKPTQLGLDLGEDAFRESIRTIVTTADRKNVDVWIDMEEPETVDATLDAFESLSETFGDSVGVCLQADLHRTPDDLERIAGRSGKLRLVKGGAYDVGPGRAYQDRSRIDSAYRELLESAFEMVDNGLAVATHDPEMIDHATALHDRCGTDFEIQMLMGVRTKAQSELADAYTVTQYVPYGEQWQRWFLNRARSNLRFATRAVGGAIVDAASGVVAGSNDRHTRS